MNKDEISLGRPSIYSEKLAQEIFERLAEGESLLQICKSEDMPSRTAVYRWAEQNDSFRDKLARARQLQAHYLFDRMMEIAFDDKGDVFYDNETGSPHIDHARLQRHRLIVDTLKFAASKLWPRVYGDKPEAAPEQQKLVISWQSAPKEPEPASKQMAFDPGPLPSRMDGIVLTRLIGLIKARVPQADQRDPLAVLDEVCSVIDEALQAKYGAN